MKPHENKPKRRAAKGAVRRQIHAHLGWLRGFPMGSAKDQGIPWHVVPDQLLDAVREAVRPEESRLLPLHPMHLVRLVELPELDYRPTLAIPLANELPVGQLPPSSQVRLARLLRLAGETERGRRILDTVASRRAWRGLSWYEKHMLLKRLAEEFIDIGLPHRALRLLRMEREDVTWTVEADEIALLTVDALIGLYRHSQAANVCRALLGRRHLDDSLRKQLRSRLKVVSSGG